MTRSCATDCLSMIISTICMGTRRIVFVLIHSSRSKETICSFVKTVMMRQWIGLWRRWDWDWRRKKAIYSHWLSKEADDREDTGHKTVLVCTWALLIETYQFLPSCFCMCEEKKSSILDCKVRFIRRSSAASLALFSSFWLRYSSSAMRRTAMSRSEKRTSILCANHRSSIPIRFSSRATDASSSFVRLCSPLFKGSIASKIFHCD